MKKYILGFIFAVMAPIAIAYAATPMLTVSGGSDNDSVTVMVTGGEVNAPVELFYNRIVGTVAERRTLGTTDINGNFTGVVSTAALGITQVSPVYVQVGGFQSLPVNWPFGTGTVTGNAIVFSQTSPTLSTGQTGTVTISGGGGGSYYIASNSNPNFTSASISGNTLTVIGTQQGQTSITVCSTSGPCAVVTPTFNVTGTGGFATTTGATGSPTLSASNINVNQNGQGSITISGGTTPYTVSVPSGSGLSTTLVGNTLFVNGNNATGSNVIQVCSANTGSGSGACTPFTVTMLGQGQATTTTTGTPISFVLPLASGEALRLSLSGGTGTYYLQSSATTPVMATINGNILTLSGSAVGQTTINVCSTTTSATTCLPIAVSVSPSSTTGTGGGFLFDTNLSMGMSGQDVLELQNRLRDEGYFNVTPTGYFGPLTESAVRAYQAANGISAVGIVGPQTRARLNQ